MSHEEPVSFQQFLKVRLENKAVHMYHGCPCGSSTSTSGPLSCDAKDKRRPWKRKTEVRLKRAL